MMIEDWRQNTISPSSVLSEVVSLEAWRSTFDPTSRQSPLRIAASFKIGRMGGSSIWPHAFRIAIKQAEIWVVIPETEPVKVCEDGVFRPTGLVRLRRKVSQSSSDRVQDNSKRNLQLGITALGVSGGSDNLAERSDGQSEDVEAEFQSTGFKVVHGEIKGSHGWQIQPEIGHILHGSVWDADTPKLTLESLGNLASSIEPFMKVEIRCLREDIHIELVPERSEAEIKDEAQRKKIPRLAAAEACLRNAIIACGLEAPMLEHAFGQTTLASVLVSVRNKNDR